jgi:hypothetical protein
MHTITHRMEPAPHPPVAGDYAILAVDQHRCVNPNSRMLAAICVTCWLAIRRAR